MALCLTFDLGLYEKAIAVDRHQLGLLFPFLAVFGGLLISRPGRVARLAFGWWVDHVAPVFVCCVLSYGGLRSGRARFVLFRCMWVSLAVAIRV